MDAALFFKTYIIDGQTTVNNVYGMFENTFMTYSINLRKSLLCDYLFEPISRRTKPLYYNYLILDAAKLSSILQKYVNNNDYAIENSDVEVFKHSCLYVGKGTNDRKFHHSNNLASFLKKNKDKPPSKLFLKTLYQYRKYHRQIYILQLHPEYCKMFL